MSKMSKRKYLTDPELSAFCSQMAMILQSGISAMEGISILLEDAANEAERKLLSGMSETLSEGEMLSAALERAGVFPDYMVRMTAVGEETGTLDDVMASLSDHYEREEMISQSIRNALTYPLIMIAMMIVVILILVAKVMPVFAQVFRQLGHEMTGLSKGILMIGNTLSAYSYVFLAIVAVIAVAALWLTHSEAGQKTLRSLGHRFRFTRDIYEKKALCRFAGGMSLALKSGLTPERGLELTEGLTGDELFQERLNACRADVEDGLDLSEALVKEHIFSGIYARMAAIAQKAGTMDEVTGEIADRCEEEVNARVSAFISVLEPTLVIILSVITGIILLSVMLPLLGIMAGL